MKSEAPAWTVHHELPHVEMLTRLGSCSKRRIFAFPNKPFVHGWLAYAEQYCDRRLIHAFKPQIPRFVLLGLLLGKPHTSKSPPHVSGAGSVRSLTCSRSAASDCGTGKTGKFAGLSARSLRSA